jgi:DNA repair protein RadA/Sms
MPNNGILQRDPSRRRAVLIEQLEDAEAPDSATLPLARGLSWFDDELGGIPRGAAILLSGDPGLGKTTLALQVASAAATLCQKVLYVATEQSEDALSRRLSQVSRCPRAKHYLHIKDDLYDLRVLPALLSHQLLNPNSPHYGTRLVIIDSLQGCAGLSPSDRESWSAILDFMRRASGAGLSILALAHRTKGGAIAGPRTLEHSCDVTMLMRRGVACRSLEVLKNRFGPSSSDPVPLRFNMDSTCLEPAPIGHGATASVHTLGGGGIISIEAAIIPARADRGYLKCPGMRAREVETLADTLERCWPQARTMWALGVTMRAPAGYTQSRDHGLAIVAVLMAALRRAAIPDDTIVIGDIGLDGRAVPASEGSWQELEDAMNVGELEGVRRIVTTAGPCVPSDASIGCDLLMVTDIGELEQILEADDE